MREAAGLLWSGQPSSRDRTPAMSRFTQHTSLQFKGQQVLGQTCRWPVQNATELLERCSMFEGQGPLVRGSTP